MKSKFKLSPQQTGGMLTSIKSGRKSYSYFAKKYNVNKTTIARICKKHNITSSFNFPHNTKGIMIKRVRCKFCGEPLIKAKWYCYLFIPFAGWFALIENVVKGTTWYVHKHFFLNDCNYLLLNKRGLDNSEEVRK